VSHPPKNFPTYVASLTFALETNPLSFEDVAKNQVWHDAMTKEYNSILKNDVSKIVPRPSWEISD
jgi:hypothetical protein